MAIINIYTLDLDIKNTNYISEPSVTSSDSVRFVVNVTDDGLLYDLTPVTVVTIAHTRPDGIVVLKTGTKTGTNQMSFDFGSTETSVSGRVDCKVQMYDADDRVSTLYFTYMVTTDPSGVNYVPSTNDQTLIQEVLGEGPQIIADAETATINANTAATNANTVSTNVQTAENIRVTAENTRKTNETSRQTAETNRVTAESSRVTAESTRQSNETTRTTNETTRQSNETTRQTNETTRQTNETARQTAITNLAHIGAWSSATAYKARNIVTVNNQTAYMCLVDHTNQTPPNATYWRVIVDVAAIITSANTATTNANTATTNANTATTNANTATTNANTATTNANTAITNLAHIGAWSSATAYKARNIVTVNNQIAYMCLVDHTNQPPPNATYWRVIVDVSAAITSANTATTAANTAATNANTVASNTKGIGTYSASTTYQPNNFVQFNGSSYMALVQVIGVTPGTDATKWMIAASKGIDGTGAGSVMSVASANSDISVTDPTNNPVLTLNSSVTAANNSIVKRNASGDIAAVAGAFTGDVTISKSGASFIADATLSNPRYWLKENGVNRGVLVYVPGTTSLTLQMYESDGSTIANAITMTGTSTVLTEALTAPGGTFTGDVTVSKTNSNIISNATTGTPQIHLQENGSNRIRIMYDTNTNEAIFRLYETDGTTILNSLVLSATATTFTDALIAPGGTFTGNVTVDKASAQLTLDATTGNPALLLREAGSLRGDLVYDQAADRLLLRQFDTDGITVINQIQLTATATTFSDAIVATGGTFTGDVTVNKASPYVILDATSGNPILRLRETGSDRGLFYYDAANDQIIIRLLGTDGATILGQMTLSSTATTFTDPINAPGATLTGDVKVTKATAQVIADTTSGNAVFRLQESGSDRGWMLYEAATDTVKIRLIGTDGVTSLNEIVMSATATTFTDPITAPGATLTGDLTVTNTGATILANATTGNPNLLLRENGSNRGQLYYDTTTDTLVLRVLDIDGVTTVNSINMHSALTSFSDPLSAPGGTFTGDVTISKATADIISDATTGNANFTLKEAGSNRGRLAYAPSIDTLILRLYGTDGTTPLNEITLSDTSTTFTEKITAPAIELNTGGNVLALKAGATQDHAYMGFYADSQAQETRSAWFGYGGAGGSGLSLVNEVVNGNIDLNTNGTGVVNVNGSRVHTYDLSPSSLGVNGYQKFPSGVIIQWGRINVANGTSQSVTFPIAFPNTCQSVQASIEDPGTSALSTWITNRLASSFAVRHSQVVGRDVDWFAIGY